jgi:TonB family protein
VRRSDLVTAGVALVVHAGLALAIVRTGKGPPKPPPARKTIVLQYERKAEPPPAPAKPVEAAPTAASRPAVKAPRPRKVAFAPRVATAQPSQAASSQPPPPAPVFAVAMSSDDASGVAVPKGAPGGMAAGRPGGSGPASGSGDGTGFRPASARDVGSMPEVDTEACGRAAVYPREAERSGTEGDVRLRVALTDEGKVHDVRVLTSLGRGFDTAAVEAIKHRCKFKPAIGRDGQPVAFVIQSYTFHFELPR